MLKVYAAAWCPHCVKTVEFLKKNQIEFHCIDIEKAPADEVKKVIEVNGGHDWVVPTLEYKGKWRKGKFFNAEGLKKDLAEMGVIIN
ncbi:MAG: NrdH-redoxin [Desulfobacteraceae bacterium IS3]|nr:MAG: NrdH-redoxin [Desulfobacteraceae bacterium IS3]